MADGARVCRVARTRLRHRLAIAPAAECAEFRAPDRRRRWRGGIPQDRTALDVHAVGAASQAAGARSAAAGSTGPRRIACRDPSADQEERQEKPQAFVAPPIVLDEAVHPRQPAAAAAAAPAAPSPQEPGANAAADMQIVDIPPSASAPAMRERDAAAPAAKAAASAELGALQRAADQAERAREQAEPQYAEPDEEVVPPATTGNPEVRDAWLQRIRELQKAGQVEDARVSLKAFRKRYPEYIIPEDLRPLEK
jgi:hypothetical protein